MDVKIDFFNGNLNCYYLTLFYRKRYHYLPEVIPDFHWVQFGLFPLGVLPLPLGSRPYQGRIITLQLDALVDEPVVRVKSVISII